MEPPRPIQQRQQRQRSLQLLLQLLLLPMTQRSRMLAQRVMAGTQMSATTPAVRMVSAARLRAKGIVEDSLHETCLMRL